MRLSQSGVSFSWTYSWQYSSISKGSFPLTSCSSVGASSSAQASALIDAEIFFPNSVNRRGLPLSTRGDVDGSLLRIFLMSSLITSTSFLIPSATLLKVERSLSADLSRFFTSLLVLPMKRPRAISPPQMATKSIAPALSRPVITRPSLSHSAIPPHSTFESQGGNCVESHCGTSKYYCVSFSVPV